MGSMLTRVQFPSLVKASSAEFSRISNTLASSILEIWMRMYQSDDTTVASGVIAGLTHGTWTAGDGMQVRVQPGLAFRYDATGISLTGDAALADHPYRLVSLREETLVTLAAADLAQTRFDMVYATPAETNARQTNVPIYDSVAHSFTGTNKYLDVRNTPTLGVVTGTPGGSVPSAPAGSVALFAVQVPSGVADASTCTYADARTRLYGPGSLAANWVKKVGDTMTGSLTLGTSALLKFASGGARQLISVANSTAGIWYGGGTDAAPIASFKSVIGETGATWKSGIIQAIDRLTAPTVRLTGTAPYMAVSVEGTDVAGLQVTDASTATPALELIGSSGQVGTTFSAGTVHAHDGHFTTAAASLDDASGQWAASRGGLISGSRLACGHLSALDTFPASPTAAQAGYLWQDLVPFAMGIITMGNPPTSDHGRTWNLDFASAARTGVGEYTIDLLTPEDVGDTLICMATPASSSSRLSHVRVGPSAFQGKLFIYAYDEDFAPSDFGYDFTLVVYRVKP